MGDSHQAGQGYDDGETLNETEGTDVNRCKTCKHWEKPKTDYGDVPGTGKCLAVVQFFNATEWSYGEGDDEAKRTFKPEYVGKLAFVQDASDYYAELKTLAEFGCVQHEEAA